MYDKEAIYDDKINPLMAEIIKICKENQIHMLASFYLKEGTEDEGQLYCTTHLSPDDPETRSQKLIRCCNYIYSSETPFIAAVTITKQPERR